jgi:hypothetical protein
VLTLPNLRKLFKHNRFGTRKQEKNPLSYFFLQEFFTTGNSKVHKEEAKYKLRIIQQAR